MMLKRIGLILSRVMWVLPGFLLWMCVRHRPSVKAHEGPAGDTPTGHRQLFDCDRLERRPPLYHRGARSGLPRWIVFPDRVMLRASEHREFPTPGTGACHIRPPRATPSRPAEVREPFPVVGHVDEDHLVPHLALDSVQEPDENVAVERVEEVEVRVSRQGNVERVAFKTRKRSFPRVQAAARSASAASTSTPVTLQGDSVAAAHANIPPRAAPHVEHVRAGIQAKAAKQIGEDEVRRRGGLMGAMGGLMGTAGNLMGDAGGRAATDGRCVTTGLPGQATPRDRHVETRPPRADRPRTPRASTPPRAPPMPVSPSSTTPSSPTRRRRMHRAGAVYTFAPYLNTALRVFAKTTPAHNLSVTRAQFAREPIGAFPVLYTLSVKAAALHTKGQPR